MRFVILFWILPFSLLGQNQAFEQGVTLFHHATFYTSGPANSRFVAMVVNGQGDVLDTGIMEFLREKYQPTEIVDLKGAFVYPGFMDAHAHFLGLGLSRQIVDLIGTENPQEAIARCRNFIGKVRPPYIMGRGWDQNKFPQKKYPTKELLDEAFPNIPVVLKRIDGHAAWVNSFTLKLAGITPLTKVEGGEVMVVNGICTGILIDNAVDEVMKVIPPMTVQQIQDACRMAETECLKNGLTYVLDAGLEPDTLEIMRKMLRDKEIKIRLGMLYSSSEKSIKSIEKKWQKIQQTRVGADTAWEFVKGIKFYADGALGSRGACLLSDYADRPGHRGFLLSSVSSLKSMAERCHTWGLPLHVHAIGDSAVRMTISAMLPYTQGTDLRWRIEHCQVVHPDDVLRFRGSGIIPSVQPTHATSDMYWACERLGNARCETAYAYKNLLQSAGTIALGTDFPVEQVNPLLTFVSAVFRNDDRNFPTDGFQMKNALTRTEALNGITTWAAHSVFEEQNLGILIPGMKADFVVLPVDLMKAGSKEIREARVKATYIQGRCVYKSE